MSAQKNRFLVMSLCITPLATLALAGCCRRCGGKCTPQGLWESPTIQATRALVLVNAPELHILRIDGRNTSPSCVGEGGVREYYLPIGEHRVTASFRYQAPVSGDLIGAVEGKPLTLKYQFVAGHEYVAVYHEHRHPRPQAESFVEAVAMTLLPVQDRTWSMDIVDLAHVGPDSEPHVKQAQLYCSIITAERKTRQTY